MLESRKLRLGAPLAATALAITTWSAASAAHGASAAPRCNGHAATIVSRHDGATITGTSGNDVIVALGVDVTVQAGDGADSVCLTAGGEVHGGAGNDVLFGSRSSDALFGDDGDDLLSGGAGFDHLSGGAGNDQMYGGSGHIGDWFSADAGNDVWVEGKITTLDSHDFPGASFDFSEGATSGVHVDLSGPIVDHVGHGTADSADFGHDRLRFLINDGSGAKVIGTAFDDKLVGSRRSDDLQGHGGADVVWGLRGNDELGGLAPDATRAPGITFIWGGPGSDHLVSAGNTRQAVLHGGTGDDSIEYGQESTHATGDDGSDVIRGYVSPDKDVVLDGGAGTDTVWLTLRASDRRSSYGTVTADLGAGTLTTSTGYSRPLAGFENISVSTDETPALVDALVLRGTDLANKLGANLTDGTPASLYGLGGDDVLAGGDGDDHLDGGSGTDTGDGHGGHNTCVDVEIATNCS